MLFKTVNFHNLFHWYISTGANMRIKITIIIIIIERTWQKLFIPDLHEFLRYHELSGPFDASISVRTLQKWFIPESPSSVNGLTVLWISANLLSSR